MLSSVVVVSLYLIGFSTAFTENDWKYAIVGVYSKLTKHSNQRNFDSELRELFTENSEELWPGLSGARKEDLVMAENRVHDKYPAEHRYLAFVELIFSSSDVAIARAVEYNDLPGHSHEIFNALDMFVRNGTEVKIKLSMFNSFAFVLEDTH